MIGMLKNMVAARQQEVRVDEAKKRLLRTCTMKELENLAKKYGVRADPVELDEFPRRALGLALVNGLSYEIIKKERGRK